MKSYRYKGDVEVHIPGVGIFEVNKLKIHEVEREIDHPDFEEVKESHKEDSKIKHK